MEITATPFYLTDVTTEDALFVMVFEQYLMRHQKWSNHTFGAGKRTEGILAHISLEMDEVRKNPQNPLEWVDIIILAIDGALREGTEVRRLAEAFLHKQNVNISRRWPMDSEPDKPTEHIRDAPQ